MLACIRRRGFAEEVVVCEDLSKGGLSFRSRNQYAENSRVEVAVPFTPGTGAIFVPIRIVFSQSIPSAGIHYYGPYFAPDKVGCHSLAGCRAPQPDEYERLFGLGLIRIATCAAELQFPLYC